MEVNYPVHDGLTRPLVVQRIINCKERTRQKLLTQINFRFSFKLIKKINYSLNLHHHHQSIIN